MVNKIIHHLYYFGNRFTHIREILDVKYINNNNEYEYIVIAESRLKKYIKDIYPDIKNIIYYKSSSELKNTNTRYSQKIIDKLVENNKCEIKNVCGKAGTVIFVDDIC